MRMVRARIVIRDDHILHCHRHPDPPSPAPPAPSRQSAAPPASSPPGTAAGDTLTFIAVGVANAANVPSPFPCSNSACAAATFTTASRFPDPLKSPSAPLNAGLPAANARELPEPATRAPKQNRNSLRRVHRNIQHPIAIEVRHRKTPPPRPRVVDSLQRQAQITLLRQHTHPRRSRRIKIVPSRPHPSPRQDAHPSPS